MEDAWVWVPGVITLAGLVALAIMLWPKKEEACEICATAEGPGLHLEILVEIPNYGSFLPNHIAASITTDVIELLRGYEVEVYPHYIPIGKEAS